MAVNLDGMRPVQGRNTGGRRKSGRETVNRTQTQTTGLTPAASRVQSYAGAPAVRQDSNAENLARALGVTGNALGSLADTIQTKTDNDILNSAEYHMERIREELGTGVINSVQVGEMLPEASHTIVAKISQALGAKQADEMFQPYLEMIEQDDTLRLDSARRNELLATIREEATGVSDDPFFINGVMEKLDAQINQNEQRWLLETAKYHKGVLAERYTDEITNNLLNGGDLEMWDSVAKETGPFVNTERKAMVATTAMNLAVEMEDPSILDRVPDLFLNAETKREFAVTQQNIRNSIFQKFTQTKALEDYERTSRVRNEKIRGLKEFTETGTIKLSNYINDPEAYSFLSGLSSKPPVDTYVSNMNASKVRNQLMTAAFTGNNGILNGLQGPLTFDSAMAYVGGLTGINAAEKAAIIDELPKLLEAQTILEQPSVVNDLNNFIKPSLAALRSTDNAEFQQQLNGLNLESRVLSMFESDLNVLVDNYYRTNNALPTGSDLRALSLEARNNAMEVANEIARIASLNKTPEQARNELAGDGRVTTPETQMVRVKDPVTGEWRYEPAEPSN